MWQYRAEFYSMKKAMSIRMTPKLTYKHIYLPTFTKMRVILAAQVFSHSVAVGINTLTALNCLPLLQQHLTDCFVNLLAVLILHHKSTEPFSQQYWPHTTFARMYEACLKNQNRKLDKALPCFKADNFPKNVLFSF